MSTRPRFVETSGDPDETHAAMIRKLNEVHPRVSPLEFAAAVRRELIRRRLTRIQARPREADAAQLGTDRERAEELVDIQFKEGRL